jgi:hypothetical protein
MHHRSTEDAERKEAARFARYSLLCDLRVHAVKSFHAQLRFGVFAPLPFNFGIRHEPDASDLPFGASTPDCFGFRQSSASLQGVFKALRHGNAC